MASRLAFGTSQREVFSEVSPQLSDTFTNRPSTLKYRSDIDGLRAIAVLSVIGFHVAPGTFGGGFVGVDIFFVISGFLISTIIIQGLAENRFSYLSFYARRIRRIFPALLLLLICVAALGWFLLLPEELWQLAKHAASASAFVANYAYLNESGYFDSDAVTKPLLHLWSLGVEEQFYICWPLLLWLFWGRVNIFALVLAIGAASFALNVIEFHRDPYTAFYSIQTRAWELAIGSLVAALPLAGDRFISRYHAYSRRVGNNRLSICGAALIFASIFLFSQATLFLGYAMVLPTLGALLLILAGEKAWFNRQVLSNPLLVWFGLISYPLYLWHWPLISFAWIVEGPGVSRMLRVAAVAASVVLAWLTYRFVEQPIRYGVRGNLAPIGLLASMALAAALSFSIYIVKPEWLPNPHNRTIVKDGDVGSAPFLEYYAKHFSSCVEDNGLTVNNCIASHPGQPIKIAILGDSHAHHLLAGLAAAFPETNIAYLGSNDMGGWIRPLPSINNPDYRDIFRYVMGNSSIATVIISTWWDQQLAYAPIGSSLENELKATAAALTSAGKKVYLADDIPTFWFAWPQLCKYARELAPTPLCTEDRSVFEKDYRQYYSALQSVATSVNGAQVLNLAKFFCDPALCSMVRNGALLYRDPNHLNVVGSLILGRLIASEHPDLAK
jgi:peptidoglycan/LPS O-acetylase OafA/YrhL